ncbi:flagellar biosynthetic protein FlhB/type III secretion protein U [Trinickia symbiotica]|uniref:EscU/YscU/HrcU family type III secretion system export apparatus switch protein n=1 Tax=Trinickia symbiotica TaxID=863227 RepID=A0A2N7X8D1_9BURK|nr:EscU/YscU/HrcU family type III secretion system export apparatus switch protein [Trinickia symbiotica]PMS37861.1 hypothetical protein C0Z20_03285 [Trinickia symbiotica]PPK47520.1 flagellar biosynthetic protein FlhB/type III secretion protein U [Trinickia symbiotica]
MSEKPLPPTEKRLRDARDKGDVPRSEPLTAWFAMAFAIEAVFASLDIACGALLDIMHSTFDALEEPHIVVAVARSATNGARLLASALAVVAASAVIGAIVAAWVSGGGLRFAPKALKPSSKRMNPLTHFRQMLSAKHLTDVLLSLITALAIGLVAYAALIDRMPLFLAMLDWQSAEHAWRAGVDTLHALVRTLLAASVAPAAISALVAKRHYLRRLRMSYHEANEELKQTAGDPLVRARQRASRLESATAVQPVDTNTMTGCVLVTNPEHLAVLLYYQGDERAAPVILEKGAGAAAERMAEAAGTRNVPIFRFRKLARHLYEHGTTNSMIPPDCYRTIAIVYRLADEMRSLGVRAGDPVEIDDALFDDGVPTVDFASSDCGAD